MDSSDDEDYVENTKTIVQTGINDFLQFPALYNEEVKHYKTRPFLTKYEKTKVLSERAQQLSNGATSFLKNASDYSTVTEIAMEELKQKKIPFIIRRPFANKYEYWKLEDLEFI